jgi:hypothetical protein
MHRCAYFILRHCPLGEHLISLRNIWVLELVRFPMGGLPISLHFVAKLV